MNTKRKFYLSLVVISIACQAATVLPKVTVKTKPTPPTKTVSTFTYNLDPSLYQ